MRPLEQGTLKTIEGYKRDSEEYDRLRSLVLGDEYQKALDALINRAEDEDRVADVLAEAFVKRNQQDSALTESLAPTIDKAIQTSIDENPKRIINVIFPILGPAVRKAVAAALADMVQTLNNMLEQSLNFRSLWWRVQAMRAGMPYAQYILLHTLKFRVEQLLLVHRETGVLLHHVSQPGIQAQDPELVSSMLTAITDFVSDSFTQNDTETLEGIRFGDFLLDIEVGPDAILAAAVRGTLSEQARVQLSEALEVIHSDYAHELKEFDGDRETFESTDDRLKACLLSQEIDEKPIKKFPIPAIIFFTVVTIALCIRGFNEYQLQAEQRIIIKQLEAEPGYFLIDHSRIENTLNIKLIREHDALPVPLLRHRLSSQHLELSILQQTINTPTFVAVAAPEPIILKTSTRIQSILSEHDQISTEETNGVLKLSGVISQTSLNQLLIHPDIDLSVQRIDLSNAQIIPDDLTETVSEPEIETEIQQPPTDQEAYQTLVNDIAGTSFYFQPNSLDLEERGQATLVVLIRQLKLLQDYLVILGLPSIELLIMGFADSQGSESTNERISQARANHIRELLIANDVQATLLISWGVGYVKGSTLSPEAQRRVSISIASNIGTATSEAQP